MAILPDARRRGGRSSKGSVLQPTMLFDIHLANMYYFWQYFFLLLVRVVFGAYLLCALLGHMLYSTRIIAIA